MLLMGMGGKSAATAAPLDAHTTGLTGAWSMGRKLLTAYGGSFYTDTGGFVSTLFDQSSAARNFTAGAGVRPAVSTFGSLAAADFTVNVHAMNAAALSNFIAANAGYMVGIWVLDGYATTRSHLVHDVSSEETRIGVDTATQRADAYNFDGSVDIAQVTSPTIGTGAANVIAWRHEGGTLGCAVNGGTEVTTASGNTSTRAGPLQLGKTTSFGFDGKLLEFYIWNAVPSSGDRAAIVAQAKTYAGI